MLAEWLKHLTTPCPKHLRAMGYLREAIAIEARHRRCRAAWAPHLENCRRVVMEAAAGAAHGRVTVLGSGLLSDVPLAELAETFDDVVLVDILHVPAAAKRAGRFANVRQVTADLTGVAGPVYRHVADGRTGPLPPPRGDTGALAESDLVVSANLLTQLPLMPMGHVRNHGRGYDDEAARAYARRIVDHHLELLAALPGRVALLTETARVVVDGPHILQEIDPLFGARIPRSGRKWTWRIAPRPEISSRYDLEFRMTGIADLPAAP